MLTAIWLFMKANDQLRSWFEDDEALERAINGEYVSELKYESSFTYFFPQLCSSFLFQL